jgi:hypothetical protein
MKNKQPWRLDIPQLSETELRSIVANNAECRRAAWAELSRRQERVRYFREAVLPKLRRTERNAVKAAWHIS